METVTPATAPGAPAPLSLPEGLCYECVQCGRSCSQFWEIRVDPQMAEQIRQRPAGDLRRAGAADPTSPIVPSAWDPGQFVMRLHGGRCVLQNEAGLCTLHTAFGFDSKPNICRSFPYRFIQTPLGTVAGLSFACTAVLGNQGPPVASQRAELEHLLSYTHNKRAFTENPALTTTLALTWGQYERLEADLTELLDPASGPLPDRLIAQSIYLGMLIKFLGQARRELNLLNEPPEHHEAIFERFRQRMRGPEGGPRWEPIVAMARRRRHSPLLRRMFLGFAHQLRNTSGQRQGRLRSYAGVARAYVAWITGRGQIDLPRLPRPIPHAAREAVAFDLAEPAMAELALRYQHHRLFRKDLLAADSIHWAHSLMLMQWGLVHWYATAHAAAAGRTSATPGDLGEAIRTVEEFFAFHSSFDRLFASYPLLRGFLDYMFGHPLFAFTMARPHSEG